MLDLRGQRILINGVGWFGGWLKDCLQANAIRVETRQKDEPWPAKHFDMAIHAASGGAKDFLDYCEDNRIGRSIYLSSGAVYQGDDTYAYQKRADEKMCGDHPANPVIARCYTFVGPRQNLSAQWAVANFLADALAKRTIHVKGDGSAIRSYMHMADMVVWILTLLAKGKPGKPYNVGSDEPISIADLANRVAMFSGSEVRIEGKKNGANFYVPGSFSAQNDLNLATHIRLNDALERTWRWLN